ncbi:hypothetical protein BSL78_26599 [Apostichopus japonicus]|uniref:Uncharacterized protein n=1 Tax=Stichopus japonicus TaxID=307972 RepID=A0A2G8JLH9_STIJA|nr:hypothetical protein BSL78_26599 [Apostichopus japonicus]
MELSSLLIENGIIEPADQEKLNQVKEHAGLMASQKEFADILIQKSDWMEEEIRDFQTCLEKLNLQVLISKIFREEISEDEKLRKEGSSSNEREGNSDIHITVEGDGNQVTSNNVIHINHCS